MSETSPEKGLIALIDDDGGVMDFYEDELVKAGFKVNRIMELPAALKYIETTTDKPDLWVIDVMMPVLDESVRVENVLLSEATSWGLTSGRILYRQIRKRPEFKQTPLILFTNVPSPEILNDLERELDANALCESKIMLDPSAFVELIEELTSKPSPAQSDL